MAEGQTIGDRVKAIRIDLGMSQQDIADRLGMSLRAWQKMERDEGTPSGETLLLFEKLGINPGWVLAGLGPKLMYEEPAIQVPQGVDVVLFQRVGDTVQTVFIECKQRPPQRALLAETANFYNELLSLVTDVRDEAVVEALIPVVRSRFKERLAKAEPGTGKRSAS
ncbi:transcriptional regulator protein [Rhizobium etli 8C-3]|uniref:Transcriptional regulator protein n=1 Tax=Rhizobium etli 8C-3 TaxID=538025 RepID=A0A1L5P7Q3_RHIET|nr:helix-turn-helix transcriptional regulator [Rhizobium etli]APO76072.1 transcriptional regulator protein [Rhizobium etli 8C-3]